MLREKITKIIQSGELDYYNINLTDWLFDFSKETIKNLIYHYFESGGKKQLISFEDIRFLPEFRWTHSFSLFLIGEIVGEVSFDGRSLIKKIINQFTLLPDFFETHFVFYWFLCVLFHDVGYSISQKYAGQYPLKTLKWVRARYNIEHSIYNEKIFLYPFDIPNIRSNKSNRNLNPFSRNLPFCDGKNIQKRHCYNFQSTIENNRWVVMSYYEAFRNHENPQYREMNHGIIGGEMFFSFLCDEYKRNFQRAWERGSNPGFSHFVVDNLYWQDQLFDVYRIISDVIISHSIWSIPTSDNENLYREYHLEQLPHFGQKLTLENPLLFLLCLVDTIDPTKYFIKKIGQTFTEMIDQVDIQIEGSTVVISSSEKEYIDFINELKIGNWMNVSVKNSQGKIRIEVLG